MLILTRIPRLVAILVVLVAAFGNVAASAQSTQAVSENWRNADFAFVSRMMAADASGNIYVLGDTVVGDYLVVKKFSPGGALLWQATHDSAERLRGIWIAVDHNGNPV